MEKITAEEILNKNRANVLESMEEYASIRVREERERIKRERIKERKISFDAGFNYAGSDKSIGPNMYMINCFKDRGVEIIETFAVMDSNPCPSSNHSTQEEE